MKQLAAERQSQDAIPAHYALQQQWFENRASRKRAAPTPEETPIGTPQSEAVDETMEPPPSQAVTAPMPLFQPIVIQEEAAAALTAASAAEIDPQDVQAVKQYFSQAVDKMTPNDRLYQIDWMLSQVATVRNFVEMGGWGYPCLNALSMDPINSPASNGHSGVTILHFKAWDVTHQGPHNASTQQAHPVFSLITTIPMQTGSTTASDPPSPEPRQGTSEPTADHSLEDAYSYVPTKCQSFRSTT